MMKKNSLLLLLLLLLLSISIGFAQSTAEFFLKADTFFKSNVKDGGVTYKLIKDNPVVLNELIEMTKEISFNTRNTREYNAFWINAYNLFVIKGVIDNYPLKSPLDIDGFFDNTKYSVSGQCITLNEMEHQLLREDYSKDPRFHFVLVCAGNGCPPIIDEAYIPSRLNSQLNRQTSKAVNDPYFIRKNKDKVKISKIFEWYKSDFEQNGSIIDFINRYKSERLSEKIEISYYPYDWTLNEVQ